MLYLRTQYIYSPFILAFKSSLHFGDPDMIFFDRNIPLVDASEIGSFRVPALFILKYQSRIPTIETFFFFSVKSRMSTTDEEPLQLDGQLSLMMVSIKLPIFWTDSPKVWFLQAKAQFAIKPVMTSMTKFYH